ncbi:hypothetical protein AA103196_1457 [Ameyamaea chiangmaiensis NBRC 103196]|nr:hypothetical protein AA103196_1457 [Ameyamaea chiangmaiensis NBRC 103196]
MWGLNLGTGRPEQAAREAAAVATHLGPALLAFQIGNEADLFNRYGHAMRGPAWSFTQFLHDWTRTATAVVAACPNARFWGPDVAVRDDWIVRFAQAIPASLRPHVTRLSAHYYAEGPPDAPDSTIAHLLADDPRVGELLDTLRPVLHRTGLPFAITEAGSCFLGGKPGVSDTFASALWATDYVLRMAQGGCDNVCFHGGAAEVEHANNGRSIGAHTDADRARARRGAFYSPIAGTPETGYITRPLYRGLQAAQSLSRTELLPTEMEAKGINLSAYAGRRGKVITLVMVNRDLTHDADVTIESPAERLIVRSARLLSAPTVDADTAVTLKEAPDRVGAGGTRTLAVPHASALVVTMG